MGALRVPTSSPDRAVIKCAAFPVHIPSLRAPLIGPNEALLKWSNCLSTTSTVDRQSFNQQIGESFWDSFKDESPLPCEQVSLPLHHKIIVDSQTLSTLVYDCIRESKKLAYTSLPWSISKPLISKCSNPNINNQLLLKSCVTSTVHTLSLLHSLSSLRGFPSLVERDCIPKPCKTDATCNSAGKSVFDGTSKDVSGVNFDCNDNKYGSNSSFDEQSDSDNEKCNLTIADTDVNPVKMVSLDVLGDEEIEKIGPVEEEDEELEEDEEDEELEEDEEEEELGEILEWSSDSDDSGMLV